MADYCLLIQGSDGDLLEDGDDFLLGVGLDVPVQRHGMVSLLPHHLTMALAKGILKLDGGEGLVKLLGGLGFHLKGILVKFRT